MERGRAASDCRSRGGELSPDHGASFAVSTSELQCISVCSVQQTGHSQTRRRSRAPGTCNLLVRVLVGILLMTSSPGRSSRPSRPTLSPSPLNLLPLPRLRYDKQSQLVPLILALVFDHRSMGLARFGRRSSLPIYYKASTSCPCTSMTESSTASR